MLLVFNLCGLRPSSVEYLHASMGHLLRLHPLSAAFGLFRDVSRWGVRVSSPGGEPLVVYSIRPSWTPAPPASFAATLCSREGGVSERRRPATSPLMAYREQVERRSLRLSR